MSRPLEVAEDVRAMLPAFRLEEAVQARERGDTICPLCKGPVTKGSDAAVLVTMIGWQYRLALTHRACRVSQVFAIDAAGHEVLPDTFALAWRPTLRTARPRAVFLWENKTNFDGLDEGGGELEDGSDLDLLRLFGFEVVAGPIEDVAAPRADCMTAIGRPDELELREGLPERELPERIFPERQTDAWRIAAEEDGEILLVYGTALGLDHFDADHLAERIEAGKVGAATVPFRQDDDARMEAGTPPFGERSRVRLYLDRVACLAGGVIGLIIMGEAGAGRTVGPSFAGIVGGAAIVAASFLFFAVNATRINRVPPPKRARLLWVAILDTVAFTMIGYAASSAGSFAVRLALTLAGFGLVWFGSEAIRRRSGGSR